MDPTPAYGPYWGKARPTDPGTPGWHPFAYHSLDVAAVADTLWQRSGPIRQAICHAFGARTPADARRLRAWMLFFIALHDLGKLHLLFQRQAPEVLAATRPDLNPAFIVPQSDHYDHGLHGFAVARCELAEWTALSGRRTQDLFKVWLAAVMGHHGDLPMDENAVPAADWKAPFGYAPPALITADREARAAWVATAAALFLTPAGLALDQPPPRCGRQGHRLLAGLCSLSDWLGSNTDFFPYQAPGEDPAAYYQRQQRCIRERDMLTRVGLIAPSRDYAGVPALLGPGEQPRGVQCLVDSLPATAALVICEAPTGAGKTEAALALAWRLLSAGQAEAVVFALPTQATANAMLARAIDFAGQAFGHANAVLAHGNARLNDAFRRLIDAGRPGSAQGATEAAVQCADWLVSSRKRVFLGQLGVCTVDQVLLSVLPVRHSFVRALGLGRAVLIIDEVHAYDAYMNGLLVEVLRRQRAAGGSAVLLSATLPAATRARLLAAWGPDEDEPPSAPASSEPPAPYPVLWRADADGVQSFALPAAASAETATGRTVALALLRSPDAFPDADLCQRIAAAADQAGALVGVEMNTVQGAQRLAAVLAGLARAPVDLFHARYRLCDRQAIETAVIARYGRQAPRGSGRILVATQVIEQSLDLDFDWLISQVCPVDLLFQRLGRLHRHPRPRPPGFAQPTCSVLSVPATAYGLHEKIYQDSRLLWRTEQLIAAHGEARFPAAYRDWIEAVYAEGDWEDEPEAIYGTHLAWRASQEQARYQAEDLTRRTVKQFKDDDETVLSLTRGSEMGLTLLPMLADGRLLDGTALAGLDEHALPERLLQDSVPVPAGWRALLAPLGFDDSGRVRLPMEPVADGEWRASDQGLTYSVRLGLLRDGDRGEAPATG